MSRFLGIIFQKGLLLFYHKGNHEIVDRRILKDEECVRCVLHPFHAKSNQTLKPDAFMPPQGDGRVSILRLKYSSLEFAKEHGRRIEKERANSQFMGLAVLTQQVVDEVNIWSKSSASGVVNGYKSNGIVAEIVGSPMKNITEYVPDEEPVYLDDPEIEFPMHADLTYSEKCDGGVKTRMRQYAHELVKRIQKDYLPI